MSLDYIIWSLPLALDCDLKDKQDGLSKRLYLKVIWMNMWRWKDWSKQVHEHIKRDDGDWFIINESFGKQQKACGL